MKLIKTTMVQETTIYITALDRQRLEKLIELAGERGRLANCESLSTLMQELEGAQTVAPVEVPADVINMRSKVRLRDLDNGGEMVYTLIFPAEANLEEGKISVLVPWGRRCSATGWAALSSGKSLQGT